VRRRLHLLQQTLPTNPGMRVQRVVPARATSRAVAKWPARGQTGALVASLLFVPALAFADWVDAGMMLEPRFNHVAARLPNGKVLVAGGYNGLDVLATTEIFDPATHSWTPAASMSVGRDAAGVAQLANGNVLVIGGITPFGIAPNSTELYDFASDSWHDAGMTSVWFDATSAIDTLQDGRVLVAGGGAYPYALCEVFNPATNAWSPVASLTNGRYSPASTLLANGKVLVAGGAFGGVGLSSAELYDPASDTWSPAGNISAARESPTATLLTSGQVLLAGGILASTIFATADLYNPTTNTWSVPPPMSYLRHSHGAALLPSGRVLVEGGGDDVRGYWTTSEFYDPVLNAWSDAGTMLAPAFEATATVLATGQVLVAGGAFPGVVSTAQLYTEIVPVPSDAGTPDAGLGDSGSVSDAGTSPSDAGSSTADGGTSGPDAGGPAADAGRPSDAGSSPPLDAGLYHNCGCNSAGSAATWSLTLAFTLAAARRRRGG